ncbi:MAG TPA: hypothetical protein DCP63_02955 [Bacteroidetes bacterium]|nr:hypothetical protein [Bacteroidota bacterium]
MKTALLLCLLLVSLAGAQISSFPYTERFDSVTIPILPPGWTTTTARSAAGDFVTTTSSPRSFPYAAISTNATISQSVTSPAFDFRHLTPERLQFYSARSGTHTAGLLVEASIDNGATFPILLTDTLRNPGSTSYALTTVVLPPPLADQASVRIRWRIVGSPTAGSSATFRLDDIAVTVATAFDIAVTNLTLTLSEPPTAMLQAATLRATVKNIGTRSVAGYALHFFRDVNFNGIGDQNELFATVIGSPLFPADSTVVVAVKEALESGEHRFFAVASFAQDSNPMNDTASATISISAQKQTLVVNEIMYDPLSGQNEWIELFHRGGSSTDLARWQISDRPTASGSTNTSTLTNSSRIAQPGDFVVVASDSTLLSRFPYLSSPPPNTHLLILNRTSGFGLNIDGDDVLLRDATGRTIDSVSYSAGWHHRDVPDSKGRSLERINPNIDSNDRRNWSTSPASAGGTPGKQNGILTTSLPTTASISISPNPFSPDNDGYEDFCIIRFNLPSSTSLIRISIFDIKGRLIRTLANSEISGPVGEIVWNGQDDEKQRARIGPYIVFIEALDILGGTLATAKAVAVVATKL